MAKLGFDATSVTPAAGEVDHSSKVWSHYQLALFDFIQNGQGSALVDAKAGSGKSASIEHASTLVKGTSIILAFNKAIADELKARGLNARTFHSLTYMPVMKSRGQQKPEFNKLHKLCDANMSGEENRLYSSFAQRLVGLARQVGIGCLVPDTESSWYDIVDHHGIELDNEDADLHRGIELARHLLAWSNASKMVDFDDMLYFAVKDGISLTKYDVVFVDEAQDTNAIQRAILRKIMHPKSRLIAVGDPAQAIYGFRGADSNSMNLLAEEFKAITLPLSITYRCPLAVVAYAQQWVPEIEARPNAPEGSVEELGTDWDLGMFKAGDLVVSRKTAPLINLAYQFIRERKPVTVLGKEIGQGLKSLIKKMNARSLDQLEQKLRAYMEREVEKAMAKKEESKAEAIRDKVDSILFLIETIAENRRTIAQLESEIDHLFESKADAVKLCTGHKSKGLEADRVWWLGRSECPATWARQDWQRQQEINICYVIATRAKQALFTFELKVRNG
jgi:DNA helicase-2/ATP-dependent DNA helicase PcrA